MTSACTSLSETLYYLSQFERDPDFAVSDFSGIVFENEKRVVPEKNIGKTATVHFATRDRIFFSVKESNGTVFYCATYNMETIEKIFEYPQNLYAVDCCFLNDDTLFYKRDGKCFLYSIAEGVTSETSKDYYNTYNRSDKYEVRYKKNNFTNDAEYYSITERSSGTEKIIMPNDLKGIEQVAYFMDRKAIGFSEIFAFNNDDIFITASPNDVTIILKYDFQTNSAKCVSWIYSGVLTSEPRILLCLK